VASPRAERCLACTAHEPSTQRAWTKEGVREAIRGWIEVHGHAPSYHEWTPSRSFPGVREAESPRWPSAAVVCDAYDEYRDPWNAALRDVGAQVRFRRWSDAAVRAALARVLGPHRPTADAGRPPHRQLGRANRENAATALRKPRSSLAGPRTCSVVD